MNENYLTEDRILELFNNISSDIEYIHFICIYDILDAEEFDDDFGVEDFVINTDDTSFSDRVKEVLGYARQVYSIIEIEEDKEGKFVDVYLLQTDNESNITDIVEKKIIDIVR